EQNGAADQQIGPIKQVEQGEAERAQPALVDSFVARGFGRARLGRADCIEFLGVVALVALVAHGHGFFAPGSKLRIFRTSPCRSASENKLPNPGIAPLPMRMACFSCSSVRPA